MDEVNRSNELALNVHARKVEMADETSTSPRSLQPSDEDHTNHNGEDATAHKEPWIASSRISNVSWKSPEATELKGEKDEKEAKSSLRRPFIWPSDRNPTPSILAEKGSDDSSGTEDEGQSEDEEGNREWSITNTVPNPRLRVPPLPRKDSRLEKEDGRRQRRPASNMADMSSRYPGASCRNVSGYTPTNRTHPMINLFSPPASSPPNSDHVPSVYAPSMLSGTTMTPWSHWPAPKQRTDTLSPPTITPAPPEPVRPEPTVPEPTPAPPPPPLPPVTQSELTVTTDPIELIETYLAELKESKQKDLLEANRILSWVDRKLGNGSTPTPVANIESYRIHDDDSDSIENHDSSSETSGAALLAPPQSTVGSPDYYVRFRRQMVEERSTVGCLTDPNVSSARSFFSDKTVRPYQLRNRSNCGDEVNVGDRIDTSHELKHHHAREYPPVGTLEAFSAESKVLKHIDLLREDVTSLHQRLNRKETPGFGPMISSTWTHWKKSFRKAPPPGTQRLEWACECGEELFADFPCTNTTELDEMRDFLTGPAAVTRTVPHTSTNPPDLEAGIIQCNLSSSPSTPNSFSSNGNASTSTPTSGNTYIGSDSSQNFTCTPGSITMGTKYLELCVNVGAYETKLAEIKIITDSANCSTICTDGLLFRKIHENYFALRRNKWRHLLYRPTGIRFVHFGVESGQRVDLFVGEPLPPEDVIAAKQWEYSPPPIDSRTFLHYFWNHKKRSSARYVRRFPKKLGESLLLCLRDEEQREGWGIHIIEGPNKPAICFALLIVLVLSFITAVVYDIIMKSRDSGFGIGQWMVASLTVALSMLYFSLEEVVNTNLA